MRVARHALASGHVEEKGRRRQAGALGKLIDLRAIDLLPGGLVLRHGWLESRPPPGQLSLVDQQVDAPLRDVDPDRVAGMQDRQTAANRRFR